MIREDHGSCTVCLLNLSTDPSLSLLPPSSPFSPPSSPPSFPLPPPLINVYSLTDLSLCRTKLTDDGMVALEGTVLACSSCDLVAIM